MSIVLYGGGVIDARGSVSGITMSRSKFGATHRAKVSPIQPQTRLQTLSRSRLGYVSSAWNSVLTATQRANWIAFALTAPVTNVFGQTSYLSGAQWFNRANINKLNSGGTLSAAIPPATSYPGVTTLSLASSSGPGGELMVTYTYPASFGTPVLYIFATPSLSPGIASLNNKLRFIGSQLAVGSPLDFSFEYITRFGNIEPIAGKQITILAIMIDQASGLASPGVVASAIVT